MASNLIVFVSSRNMAGACPFFGRCCGRRRDKLFYLPLGKPFIMSKKRTTEEIYNVDGESTSPVAPPPEQTATPKLRRTTDKGATNPFDDTTGTGRKEAIGGGSDRQAVGDKVVAQVPAALPTQLPPASSFQFAAGTPDPAPAPAGFSFGIPTATTVPVDPYLADADEEVAADEEDEGAADLADSDEEEEAAAVADTSSDEDDAEISGGTSTLADLDAYAVMAKSQFMILASGFIQNVN